MGLAQILTALDLHSAVLPVQGVVVQVHHAGQGGGEPHAVGDRPVTVKPHHLVLLRHVVEKTFLIVGKKSIRHPDFFSKITRKR